MPKEGSVNRTVKEVVLSRPTLLEALAMGVVNYSALARALRGEVRQRLGRPVSEVSVKVALLRLREHISGALHSEGVLRVLAASTLTLIDDVGLLTVRASTPITLSPLISGVRARLLQMTQGIGTVTVVTDEEVIDWLCTKLDPRLVEAEIRGQAALILVSPREIITTPGVMAYLNTLLAFSGINITQVISTHTDTILILEREKVVEAYLLLKSAIAEAKHALNP